MTSETKPPVTKDRPFPWHCFECGKGEIFPLATDYATTEIHDGQSYMICIPDLEIPTCRNCGEQLITTKVDDRINAALRARAGLLTPQDIKSKRNEIALSLKGVAEKLGVSEETVMRWEEGAIIQSRAIDNLLRSLFDSSRRLARAV
jgi:putative zinc finger/helix-turn-helix YgiT family protein